MSTPGIDMTRRLGGALALLVLASILGVAVAAMAVLFLDGSSWVFARLVGAEDAPWWLVLVLPAGAGALSGILCARTRTRAAPGPADVIRANLEGLGRLPWRDGIYAALAAFAALAGGGSVGAYGPLVHAGSTLAGHAAVRFGEREARTGLACGCAAAIAAAFNAPLAGIIFAHEVILKHYSLRMFAPVAAAALAANTYSRHVWGHGTFLEIATMAEIAPAAGLQFAVVGLACGFLATAIIKGCLGLARWQRGLRLPPAVPPAIGGFAAGLIALAVGAPELLGGGKPLLDGLAAGATLALGTAVLLCAAKLAATVACVGLGMAGGVFSPALVIGALFGHACGSLFATVLPAGALAPQFTYVLVGMFATASPVIGAPLAGILIALEFSGSYPVAVAVAIAIVVASLAGARLAQGSYYQRQLAGVGISPWAGPEERVLSRITVRSRMRVPNEAQRIRLHGARTIDASASLWDALELAKGEPDELLAVVDGQPDGAPVGLLSLEEVLLEQAHLNRTFRAEEGEH